MSMTFILTLFFNIEVGGRCCRSGEETTLTAPGPDSSDSPHRPFSP
jgi:hypothetical protein